MTVDRKYIGFPQGSSVLSLLGSLIAVCVFCLFLSSCVAVSGSDTSSLTSGHTSAKEEPTSEELSSPAGKAEPTDEESSPGDNVYLQSDSSSSQSEFSSSPDADDNGPSTRERATLASVPPFDQSPSTAVNGDIPDFDGDMISLGNREPFEQYAELDSLGRCGEAIALVGPETMPTDERGSIGEIRPSGWKIAKYDWIDGKYLYNRCHLIGYQLTGQNANERNLITGTRYLNVEGMQPFENEVVSYVRETGNHVLYRVTPVFDGDNLVASGVLMEARSVEDDGAGVCFCRWCYNVQPGVTIDYATGFSRLAEDEWDEPEQSEFRFILNTRSHRIHLPGCSAVDEMSEHNKKGFNGSLEEAEDMGYRPCRVCNPQ